MINRARAFLPLTLSLTKLRKSLVQGRDGQLVPEEVKLKVRKAFSELFDKVDSIFAEYEVKGPYLS